MLYTKFNEFFNFDYTSILKRIDMSNIQDIMNYLIDEFTDMSYLVESSLQSSIIEPDMKSFIISIYSNETDVLYYIEPNIFGIISDIDSQLKSMGFEIFYSDFGETDAWYELVVTEIGNKPTLKSSRLNESKYRSPKWLRNFFDFEINTGSDISGDKSKKQIEKEKESEIKKVLDIWDKRWRDVNEDLFTKFYCVTFKGESSDRPYYYLLSSEKKMINGIWRGDMSLWDRFDAWVELEKKTAKEKKEKQEREDREQERIKAELNKLLQRLSSDWKQSPYYDKIETISKMGSVELTYTFENGDTFVMFNNEIKYDGIKYTVGLYYRNLFVDSLNSMINSGIKRPGKRKSNNKYSDHPKGRLYQTLLDTISQREESLSKMDKDDPDIEIMRNELEAAKRQASRMRDRYKFENVSSFVNFINRCV